MVSKSIAIILARGGSKRIPHKNIVPFFEKPLIAWTIEAALKSGCFERIVISTDDLDIADVSRRYGVDVPFLRSKATDDDAPSSEATLAALGQAEKYWSERYDVVAQLMANCPLRDSYDIELSMKNFIRGHHDAQISCFRFGWMNPWWAARLDEEGMPHYLFEETRKTRSQDLPELFCPTGAVWISRVEALKSEGTFYLSGHTFFPLNWISAVDIDDEHDLAMAKMCFLLRQQTQE